MIAAKTLPAAQAAGVHLSLNRRGLLLKADCAPPPELLDALRRDKPKILVLPWTGEIGEVPPSATTIQFPNLHGLAFAELEQAAGEDWLEVRDDLAVFEALVTVGKPEAIMGCGTPTAAAVPTLPLEENTGDEAHGD